MQAALRFEFLGVADAGRLACVSRALQSAVLHDAQDMWCTRFGERFGTRAAAAVGLGQWSTAKGVDWRQAFREHVQRGVPPPSPDNARATLWLKEVGAALASCSGDVVGVGPVGVGLGGRNDALGRLMQMAAEAQPMPRVDDAEAERLARAFNELGGGRSLGGGMGVGGGGGTRSLSRRRSHDC